MSNQPASFRKRHVVVLAHPSSTSFNGLVADAYCEAVHACGQEAIVRDLYALGFDPILKDHERAGRAAFALSEDVKAELDIIHSSDVLVLIYPIWFGMPPAMLKGYIDRVLGAGITSREIRTGAIETVLRSQRLVSITSSGNSKSWLNEQHQLESLRTLAGRYLAHALGMKSFEDLHFGEIAEGLAQEYIDQNLSVVDTRARAICAAVLADQPAR